MVTVVERIVLNWLINDGEIVTVEDLFDFMNTPRKMRSDFVAACFLKDIFQIKPRTNEFIDKQHSKLDKLNQTIKDF